MARAAVCVQLQYFLRRKRRIVAPGLAQMAEQIGMLDIQLPLVDLVAAQDIGIALQRGQRRHAAAGAIQIIGAGGQIGRILNFQRGQLHAVTLHPLAQRHHAVEQRLVAAAGHSDSLRQHMDAIGLFRKRLIGAQHNIPRLALSAADAQDKPGFFPDGIAQHPGIQKRRRLRILQHDAAVITNAEASLQPAHMMRHGQKIHVAHSFSRMRKVLIS